MCGTVRAELEMKMAARGPRLERQSMLGERKRNRSNNKKKKHSLPHTHTHTRARTVWSENGKATTRLLFRTSPPSFVHGRSKYGGKRVGRAQQKSTRERERARSCSGVPTGQGFPDGEEKQARETRFTLYICVCMCVCDPAWSSFLCCQPEGGGIS